MKLFWKLFCSMVLLTIFASSIGGYVLIDSQFRTSLEREVAAVYEENDLLRFTLTREMHIDPISNQEELASLAENITINTGHDTVTFRISTKDGRTIALKGVIVPEASSLTTQLKENQRGWQLAQTEDNHIYLHVASPLIFEDDLLYLENCRDVSSLFTTRSEQYQSFFYLMTALTLAVGAASLFITALKIGRAHV